MHFKSKGFGKTKFAPKHPPTATAGGGKRGAPDLSAADANPSAHAPPPRHEAVADAIVQGASTTLAQALEQNGTPLSKDKIDEILASVAAHAPTPAEPQAGTTGADDEFEPKLDNFKKESEKLLQQQVQMQNANLQVTQLMELAKMIAEIAKKAIENYSV